MARRKDRFEDDGRTIADMSGVQSPNMFPTHDGPKLQQEETQSDRPWEEHTLSRSERFWFLRGVLKASLLIGLAYAVGIGALILLIVLCFR